jgi:hypothetical protein
MYDAKDQRRPLAGMKKRMLPKISVSLKMHFVLSPRCLHSFQAKQTLQTKTFQCIVLLRCLCKRKREAKGNTVAFALMKMKFVAKQCISGSSDVDHHAVIPFSKDAENSELCA